MRQGMLRPRLDILPPPQLALWPELAATPKHFTLYGGTALALRIGHRSSADFDFFSDRRFDPDRLAESIAYLRTAERVQVDENTLTCRVERGGPILVSFFGNLRIGQAEPRDEVQEPHLYLASLLDIAATKLAVVQKRAQERDYFDMDALMRQGIELPMALAAGQAIYGRGFNPLVALKALSYFGDVPTLSKDVRARLAAAVETVDLSLLPTITPYRAYRQGDGISG